MAQAPPFGEEDFVPIVVDQAVDGAFKIMQKKHLGKLAPSYGTCRFLSDLIKAATWVSYPHDTEKEGFSISPEDEPTSSSKDTWARSAVPIRPVRRRNSLIDDLDAIAAFRQQQPQRPDMTPIQEKTPSEASFHSRISNASKARRRRSSQMSNMPMVFDVPRVTPYEDQSFASHPGALFQGSAPNTAQRNDDLRRKEAEAAAERAASELLEKQIKDAKGAKYTIDDKGRFILIKEGPPSSGPSVTVRTKDLAPKTGDGEGPDRLGVTMSATMNMTTTSLSGSKYSQAGRKFYVENAAVQPPLTDAVKLNMGVAVVRGAVTKEGPPLWEDPDHMSVKEFKTRRARDMGETQSTISSKAPGDTTSVDGSWSIASSHHQVAASRRYGDGEDMEEEEEEEGPQFDPIDITSGGKKLEPAVPVAVRVPDVDLEVTKAPDWGAPNAGDARPGQLPHKPSSRQQRIIGKLFHGGHWPRERSLPGVTPLTAECKRLPGPPIGYVMGHGMTVAGDSLGGSLGGSLYSGTTSQRQEQQTQAGSATLSVSDCISTCSPRSGISSLKLPNIFSPGRSTSRVSTNTQLSPTRRSTTGFYDVRQGGLIKYHVDKTPEYIATKLLTV